VDRAPSIHEILKESESEFPPAVLLPSQYYAGGRQAKLACGEQRLMLAMLADAINCLLGSGRKRAGLRDDALGWLAGLPSAVSFEQACEAVGLDPDLMRTGIEKLVRNGDTAITHIYFKIRQGQSLDSKRASAPASRACAKAGRAGSAREPDPLL
jgi:hypothetical protein